MKRAALPLSLLGLAGVVALGLSANEARSATPTPAPEPTPRAALPTCEAPKVTKTSGARRAVGDPRSRQAAQKGLDFLVRESKAWGDGHKCYGCHVHAVALEAFVVGKHNQYDIGMQPLNRMLTAMTTGVGGSRGPVGLSYHDDSLLAPSKAFGGAAFAHFDQHINTEVRDDLIKTGRELLKYQRPDGSLNTSWTNWPVGAGDIQTTYQAVQTWRQIYARTADDLWLTPIRKAEENLRHLARVYAKSPTDSLQEMNYAALGLVEAGAGKSDKTLMRLRGEILERQNKDGGFGLNKGQPSSAFATGQTVYTLRQLGMVDGDRAVKAGTRWLVSNQMPSGGWSKAGSAKAEAMWGVLGLVSIDVLSIEVTGVADGRHVAGKRRLVARAHDNGGRGVKQIEILVDDVPVARACGDRIEHHWSTDSLADGMHLVDVVAENAEGKIARRRTVVYAGDHFLTDVGSRFEGGKTVLSARNLDEERGGEVEVRIYETEVKKGVPVRGKLVRTEKLGKKSGALSYAWDGKVGDKAAKSGRYIAELSFKQGARAVQKVEHLFSHEDLEAQKRNYGQVSGQLRWGGGGSANTAVELVDDDGNVVQRTTTTRSGQYRFKNIDTGKYKVRVKKKGFKAEEREVAAEAGRDISFDADMAAE